MGGRQRLAVIDVEPGYDAFLLERLDQRGLVDQRPARGVHQHRAGAHQGNIFCSDDAARAIAQHQVQADHIALTEQHGFFDALGAFGLRRLGGDVLTPGEHPHAEGVAERGHAPADPP